MLFRDFKNAECYTFDNSGGMSHITYSIYVQYAANISSRVFGTANITQKKISFKTLMVIISKVFLNIHPLEKTTTICGNLGRGGPKRFRLVQNPCNSHIYIQIMKQHMP